MRIRTSIFFRAIALGLLFCFFGNTIFIPSARAEKPCWNDGSIVFASAQGSQWDKDGQGNFNKAGTRYIDDPVNVASGNYSYEHTDISLPSVGFNIELTRYYNSHDTYEGPFGIGWSHLREKYLLTHIFLYLY